MLLLFLILIYLVEVDNFFAAKDAGFESFIAGLFHYELFFICIIDLNILFNDVVVAELSCILFQRKRYFDVSEKRMVFLLHKVLLKLFFCQFFSMFQHI